LCIRIHLSAHDGGKMKPTKLALASLAVIALLAPSAAWADTVAGTFNISGTLTLSSTSMAWGGTATVASAPTGIYSALGGTSIGITDLSTATAPVGSVFSPLAFISFTSDPSLSSLLINSVLAGVDGNLQCGAIPAAGQICTPSSPTGYLQAMNFTNDTSSSSTMSWDFSGVSADGTETWLAVFTTLFPGANYQNVIAAVGSGGSLTTSYAASITVLENPTSVAPEPSSIALLGAGLFALIGAARRKRLG
jgi:hypothetical protein